MKAHLRSIVNGRLIFILRHSPQSILFGKFIILVDKFFSSCGEDVSGFLPLPPNLFIFISSLTVLNILTD